jgi:hypothetical protein
MTHERGLFLAHYRPSLETTTHPFANAVSYARVLLPGSPIFEGCDLRSTSPLLRTSFAFGDSTPLELRTCAGRSPPKTELPRELEPRPYGGTRLLLQSRWVWHSRSYAHPSGLDLRSMVSMGVAYATPLRSNSLAKCQRHNLKLSSLR